MATFIHGAPADNYNPSTVSRKPKRISDIHPPPPIPTLPSTYSSDKNTKVSPSSSARGISPRVRVGSPAYELGTTVICPETPESISRPQGRARERFQPIRQQYVNSRHGIVYSGFLRRLWGAQINPDEQAGRLVALDTYIGVCRTCPCVGERLTYEEPPGYVHRWGCRDPMFIRLCETVFGCYCSPTLSFPTPGSRGNLTDQQTAAGNINYKIESEDPLRSPREQTKISVSEVKNLINAGPGDYRQPDQEKWMVPGMEEPYYLEGPSKPRGWLSDSRDTMARTGDFNGLGGFGKGYVKRSEMGEEIDFRDDRGTGKADSIGEDETGNP
ncbi:hypothetical protein TWF506_006967 [Arthrobotrys conoides]|uniref:Uncharacterized protein n=1 Tax=Arthrobotrys conoides TaxID=74498 RepID=A0AAN8NCX6_9PEZI